ncbi:MULTISPECIES: aminopeptidase [Halomicrobium]|uniref:Aminopeptidase n=2 Tax=Halomicrobium mukohataei TaxID=57705 RepID=C7NYK1_HALMD|nr:MULTISPECIES: aminopeptidase [Halomicrobium]ACV46662.1 aminopeptidase [Halomicrobium mukohataei DSM 12286]QCD65172.1 aminopeptidase [Halomicrobium mukohataei]QFR19978.1 aminopeptidase [Halomicrobium sp. ZPS1]
MNSSLRKPARTAVEQCLNLQSTESCAVVTDEKRTAIGEALYRVASEISDDTVFLRYPPGEQHGEEPPEPVAAAMAGADVVLAPTTKSLSHTQARSEANEAGARVATLPGITEGVFLMGLDADYEAIAGHCRDVLAQVEDADEIRVTSPQGTDITFGLGDREWQLDTGIVHEPGEMSNLPAGEVFCSPTTADGTFVVDGTMMPHGQLEGELLEFTVEDGLVTEIGDDAVRQQIEAAAETVGDAAYNLAELGIGTNVAVRDLVGSVLLDEKAGGTVHIAIGDDHAIGGDTTAPIHLDGILREPTVFADGVAVELPQAE